MNSKIKFDFWKETDHNKWRDRFEKYIYVLIICNLITIIIQQNTGALIWNGFYIIISMIIIISLNKWRKEHENRI